MNYQLQNIIKNFSMEELQAIKTLVNEIEKQRTSGVEHSVTIENFESEYLRYIKNNFSPSYLKSVTLSLSHLSCYFGESKSVNEFSIKDAEEYRVYLMKNAPLGYKVYLRNMKAAFNKAIDWEMIKSNPFAKIKISQKQQVEPRFLTREELNAVLIRTNSPIIKELFIFAFFTGCRLGEIINISWGNIDFEKGTILVGDKNFITKNKKSRRIPMSKEIESILTKRRQGQINSDYIFTKNNGFPFNRDYISRYFKKSVRAAGLSEELHFHSLRHSFASHLALKGVPITVIKELLGHSSIVVTQIYSHTNLASLKSAIQKFDELSLAG